MKIWFVIDLVRPKWKSVLASCHYLSFMFHYYFRVGMVFKLLVQAGLLAVNGHWIDPHVCERAAVKRSPLQ